MFSWIRSVAALASGIPTALALALLLGLGVWGYLNDWKAPKFASLWGKSSDTEKDSKDPKDSPEGAPKVAYEPEEQSSEEPRPRPIEKRRIEFPSAEAVRKAGIQVKSAEVRTMARYVTAPSMIDYDPEFYAQITSRAPGTVVQTYKVIGAPIKKGEVLAIIDVAEVGRVKSELLQSVVQYNLKKETLRNMQALWQKGGTPEQALRAAEVAEREAQLRLFTDQQALLNLGFSLRLEEVMDLSEKQLAKKLRLLGLPEKVREDLNLDPETATANLLPLLVPFDGTVVRRNVAAGEVLQASQPKVLYVVADLSRVHIDLNVNPQDAALVKEGQKFTFESQDRPGEPVTAKVSHFSPEVDEKTRRVAVHCEVPNPDGRLRPNMYGTGRILVREHPDAVVVPSEAIQSDASFPDFPVLGAGTVGVLGSPLGQGPLLVASALFPDRTISYVVFVRKDEKSFQVRRVQLGFRDGNFTEVTGVLPGEEVVTTGGHLLNSDLVKDRIGGGDE
jgi:cobalt-zinc-cadmium efflux system membrane fusion protein